MRDTIASLVDAVVPTPRPPLPADVAAGLPWWCEQWPWIAVAGLGVLILLHVLQVRGLRRRLRKCHISLSSHQSESAALKRQIARLNDAAAEKAMRQSQFARRRAENDVTDYENQTRFIELSVIEKKRVLNREEAAIFNHCLAVIREFREIHRRKLNVCPQVSMGQLLRTLDGNTFSSFNAKRVDILICDESWQPLVAIEHQGSGHTLGGNWAEREHIKARALARAGVRLMETSPEHCSRSPKEFQADLKTKLMEAIGMAPSVPPGLNKA